MNDRNEALIQLAKDFSEITVVDAVLLAGSAASGTSDAASDFDVYIYSSSPVPLSERRRIADTHMSYVELDNQYWEPEDDGVLKCGTPIDLVYRSSAWMDEHLHGLLIDCNPSIGYSTCFWANLMNARILFDRNGYFEALREKYQMPYPELLKERIITKNRELLKGKLPSYYDQIAKAIKRQDKISINHRIAAFLASYFDILFAVNEVMHPGEKKLAELVQRMCKLIPAHFISDMEALLSLSGTASEELLPVLDRLIQNLDALIGATYA